MQMFKAKSSSDLSSDDSNLDGKRSMGLNKDFAQNYQ